MPCLLGQMLGQKPTWKANIVRYQLHSMPTWRIIAAIPPDRLGIECIEANQNSQGNPFNAMASKRKGGLSASSCTTIIISTQCERTANANLIHPWLIIGSRDWVN